MLPDQKGRDRVARTAGGRDARSRVLEWSDLADHLADLQEAAGVELGMSPLHRLDMFGVGAPGFERFLRGKTEHGELLAVVGFERLDRQKAGKTADDVVHALAESVVFVDRGAVTQLQIANDNHFTNHVSLTLGDGFPFSISSVSGWALLHRPPEFEWPAGIRLFMVSPCRALCVYLSLLSCRCCRLSRRLLRSKSVPSKPGMAMASCPAIASR